MYVQQILSSNIKITLNIYNKMHRINQYSQAIMAIVASTVSFGVLNYMIVDNHYLEKKRIINTYEKQLEESRKIMDEFKQQLSQVNKIK
jgi:hypothetical protein